MKNEDQLQTDARLTALEAAFMSDGWDKNTRMDDLDAEVRRLKASLEYHNLLLTMVSKPKPEPKPEPDRVLSRWDQALRDLEPDYSAGAWGMSDETAKSQVSMSGGIEASRRVVDINLQRLQAADDWFGTLDQVAIEVGLPRQVLYAIADRESNQGYSLDANGEGDNGNAFGVMQVDKRYHEQQGRPDPYSYEHAHQAGVILLDKLNEVIQNHPDWSDKYLLKGAVVAYNSGAANVQTIDGMDLGTTGNDYGADVMARAQYYLEVLS